MGEAGEVAGVVADPLFAGLVYDESDRLVQAASVGDEPFYVIDDDGFLHHVESSKVDRQVLESLHELIKGHEDLITEGTMKMLGQEDIFTKAAIDSSLKNVESHFDVLLAQGLPADMRDYLGMIGFRVVINHRGEVLSVDQPGIADDPDEPS